MIGAEYVFSVFGVEGKVICCKGAQCGDSWLPVSRAEEEERLSSSHRQAGQRMEPTGLQQQQEAVVKYPPCQQPNIALRHRMETTAFIVILLFYF